MLRVTAVRTRPYERLSCPHLLCDRGIFSRIESRMRREGKQLLAGQVNVKMAIKNSFALGNADYSRTLNTSDNGLRSLAAGMTAGWPIAISADTS